VVCVYAVVRGTPRLGGRRGVAGVAVRVVAAHRVAAIVADATTRPEATLSNVRRHDRVVTAVATRVSALLPARFPTVLADDAALVRALDAHSDALDEALALVDGREQMTLRLYGFAAPAPDVVPARAPDHGPGARYLSRRLDARRADATAWELGPLRPVLASLVRAERVERHAIPPLVATVYHLVDRGTARAYLDVVRAHARLADVRVRASGPFAPYAFAPGESL